jgi:hypothetical protein
MDEKNEGLIHAMLALALFTKLYSMGPHGPIYHCTINLLGEF